MSPVLTVNKTDYAATQNQSYINISDTWNTTSTDLYIENYGLWIKILFATLGTITLITSFIACTAMYRTRKVPHAARFLAMGLLVFDSGFVIVSTIRKFVLDPTINTNLMVAGTACLKLSYVTVGLMSFERYLVFIWPNAYLRHCSKHVVRRCAFAVWTVCICTFLTLRYGLCYFQHGEDAFYVAGTCNMLVTIYYSGLVVIVTSVSFVCYYKIFNTIRRIANSDRKLSFQSAAKLLRSYKSTSLVLVYFVVILITSFAYVLILVNIRYFNLGVSELRLSLEFVNIANCFLDPYLYVLWFSETRMECIKLLSPVSGRLQKKVEMMRTQIFDIVTIDIGKLSSKVSPMKSIETINDGSIQQI